MTHAQHSALVVLKPRVDPAVPVERAGEAPPGPEAVDRALAWFRGHGFETGPCVGISFAITGDEELFGRHLGTASFAEPGGDHGDLAFPLDGLGDDVRQLVDAVVVPPPPEFGPGNP